MTWRSGLQPRLVIDFPAYPRIAPPWLFPRFVRAAALARAVGLTFALGFAPRLPAKTSDTKNRHTYFAAAYDGTGWCAC